MKKSKNNKMSISLITFVVLGLTFAFYIFRGYGSYQKWNILLALGFIGLVIISIAERKNLKSRKGIMKFIFYLIPSILIFFCYWFLTLLDVN